MHPLMDAGTLAAQLESPDLVVLDVRWRLTGPPTRPEYDAGHVPGAVFVDLDTELAGAPGGEHGRHPLPAAEDFQAVMRSAGVDGTSRVVCYDLRDGTAAARAWWLLRYFGHREVAVLDGGYAGWVAADLPVQIQQPRPPVGAFTARPGGMPLLDADQAARVAGEGTLLDARGAARYRGEEESVDPVAGHIPGAVSAPTTENVGPDGRFLAVESLSARFEALVGRRDQPVGTYCGSGITAAHQVLALELIDVPASLYADSWSGWISDSSRPVVTERR